MALRGAYLNCGQNCLSAERFYVYEGIYDEFIKRILARMPTVSQGPDSADNGAINLPAQVGGVVIVAQKHQLAKYQEFTDDAVKKGARILVGGKPNSKYSGHYFEPTVLVDVNHSMKIMQEETFGPIMTVMKV